MTITERLSNTLRQLHALQRERAVLEHARRQLLAGVPQGLVQAYLDHYGLPLVVARVDLAPTECLCERCERAAADETGVCPACYREGELMMEELRQAQQGDRA